MRKIEAVCLLLVSMLLVAGDFAPAQAGSLWLNGRDLYSTQGGREFKPGDIITIVIAEESAASQNATTNTQKDSALEVKSEPKIPYFKKLVTRFMGKNEIKNSYQGTGTTTRSGKLTGTVTAQVLEILPNGNVLVEGRRDIRVNKETQHLKIRGIARPQDIDVKNTISSKLLANAEIKYEGKGSVGSTQRPGLMTKLANLVF